MIRKQENSYLMVLARVEFNSAGNLNHFIQIDKRKKWGNTLSWKFASHMTMLIAVCSIDTCFRIFQNACQTSASWATAQTCESLEGEVGTCT